MIPEEVDKRKTLLWCMENVDQRLVGVSLLVDNMVANLHICAT